MRPSKIDLADAATQSAVRRRLLATSPPGTLLAAERCAADPRVLYDERPSPSPAAQRCL